MSLTASRFDLPLTSPLPAGPDREFDAIAALACRIVATPIALVSMLNRECQIFPGAHGAPAGIPQRTIELSRSFCTIVVGTGEPLVVSDTRRDPRTSDSPVIEEFGILAYAGMPIFDRAGAPFGSLCVMSTEVRQWSPADLQHLTDLAAICTTQFRLREADSRAAVAADLDRIATELRERVVGDLFALSMSLGALRRATGADLARGVAAALEQVDRVLVNIRDSVHEPIAR